MQALMVFTSKTVDEIVESGGTGHWNLTPSRVAGMKYAVCTYCDTPDPAKRRNVVGHLERGSAFLVGRISGLRQSKSENGRKRYIVEFSEFATLNEKDVWDHSRNPVRYVDQDYLETKGIDFDDLVFQPLLNVASAAKVENACEQEAGALTITQAKRGLAKQFGVTEDQVQITISA